MLQEGDDKTLAEYGIQAISTVHVWEFPQKTARSAASGWSENFVFPQSCRPLVEQTPKSLSAFCCSLHVVVSTL